MKLNLYPTWGFGVALAIATTIAPMGRVSAVESSPGRPRIVVIIADDLGYGDVGIHGCPDIPTPNIDSIARGGVRFSNGYVSGPYCSPTRAGLLTGCYQQRFGHEFNPPGPNATNRLGYGLPLAQSTLADRLKTAGYVTGLVGKWHLGASDPFNPVNRGFTEYFGFLEGAHSYTNLETGSANPIRRGLQPVEEKEYLTDAFTREALSFIDRHHKEPFYLQLAYNAVHSPLDLHPAFYGKFGHIADEKRRRFASLYAALDEGVGKVLGKIRDSGIEGNTLVIFFSDNGGPTSDNTSRNGPFRGFKAQTWEGGIHIPYFARWPGRLPVGAVYSEPVIQLDVHATVLAAAGVDIRPDWGLDGVNLLPFVNGEKRCAPHDALYWRFGSQLAVRQGDWKLVKAPEGDSRSTSTNAVKATTQGAHLYNLTQDPGEQNDLTAANPEKFAQLAALWNRWNSELPEPAWRSGQGARQGQASSAVPSVAPSRRTITP